MACGFKSVTALLCLISFWIFTFSGVESAAQQSAPAPAADCNNLILNLADCLSFVSNGSTEKKPAGSCCSGLKMVLKTDAACLCEGFKNSAQLGVALNITKALSLPSACHVSAPSLTNCGSSIGSGAAPEILAPPLGTGSTFQLASWHILLGSLHNNLVIYPGKRSRVGCNDVTFQDSGFLVALSPTAVSPSATAGAPSTAAGTNVVAPAPAPGSSGSASLCQSSGLLALTIGAAFFSLF